MQTKLADYLAATGKTQAALAEELGVSRQAISLYLHGQIVPTLAHAIKMRELFGISVDSWHRPEVKAKRERRSA